MASAAASSNYAATSAFSADNSAPKFDEYRPRVMLGDLPPDFLRIQLVRSQIFDPTGFGGAQGYRPAAPQPFQNPNFLGFFTLTIAEAKLIKNSGPLGLLKMDPYVRIRIGHVSYDTPTATGGGKNPQWKATYRVNLFKGMDRIHLEVFDERNFMEDSFIGESEVLIPREVLEGETRQSWYPLMGRQTNTQENQGDILLIMSFTAARPPQQIVAAAGNTTPVVNSDGMATASSSTSQSSSASEFSSQQFSPSAIPKPPPPVYSTEDVQTLQEMFPTIDRLIIIDLLDKNGGNKDLAVNQLLQLTIQ